MHLQWIGEIEQLEILQPPQNILMVQREHIILLCHCLEQVGGSLGV